MSKKSDQKFLEQQHKRIEIISALSAIAGEYTSAMVNMSVIAWAGNDGYWLRLLDMDGQGDKLLIHIDDELAPREKLYSVLGYVHHNKLNFGINSWKDFMADADDM
jgi:hypothetical protein